ncbi:MAG: UDP-N-acetylenolpyruvoylglucosamine reductase [Candidatus Magasanikbacteria bacterium CG10_big_fil_rev_8_21_14_0_10_36_32]|uniref:UDP-N-acetylenolpyruvoylglucosamine reductase n=1 Tax=Candidatus Magasanikbacteria bacterium CG10_big_fil_rev_8_21_14_0_10_36_32 TaxID=1974646 RepID=A0A2M6W5P5_9BACT|nr:MAG: UDP-N-acetylenolpyruvoylglucosamine reductase [Candidatus Magasanikbacteria bacterium CG10_big_fil_rev_8_21_14_0_10_36_32]
MNLLHQELKKYGSVKTNVLLSRHTTFKIGGPAEFLVTVDDNDKLAGLLVFLQAEGVEYFVLGGGSNVLFPDDGLRGVVVKISSGKMRVDDQIIEADAGVSLTDAVNLATKNSLSGLEWAAGIPGTIGGAVRGNSGAMGQCMSDSIVKVLVWQDGEIKEFLKEECGFCYRGSLFKDTAGMVVLKVWLKLASGQAGAILKTIQGYLEQRQGKFPPFPSAGSFFKNLKIDEWPGKIEDLPEMFQTRGMIPTGWLIDGLDLRGFKIGGGGVSQEHGNFLVNFGGATQADILSVVDEVQKKVYNKYGVTIEPEVEIIH